MAVGPRHCEEPTGRAKARPMTGSATKQPIPSPRRDGLLASLAMTAPIFKHERAFSQREAPELCKKISALRNQRAQGMPGAQCARSLVCKKTNTRVSHHGHTGNHPAFPAQWFYGLFRALPGDQACLTPSPALLLADLTPASGRQNHTTSPSAAAPFVKCAARVHRIPPRVRDDRETPLWGTGRGGIYK